jgi:hypothetical protein
MASCHENKRHFCKGLCKACYSKEQRRINADQERIWQRESYERKADEYKATARNTYLLKRYNITLAEYEEMLLEQDYCCKACGRHQRLFNKSLAVDHNHACCAGEKSCGGCVRGLLCGPCNTALGLLEDSRERIKSLDDYLVANTFKEMINK